MTGHPRSILIISWFFIAFGAISTIAAPLQHLDTDLGLVMLSRIAAVVSGVFMLRGFNWARWLLVLWMAFHIVISFGNPPRLLVHCGLFAVLLYFLFRGDASAWFRAALR